MATRRVLLVSRSPGAPLRGGISRLYSSSSGRSSAPPSGGDFLHTDLSMQLPSSGLLAVYKPQNWTSSDVVSKVKSILQRGAQAVAGGRKCKIKVGHGGTLDPLAEGVLVLGIGEGTKLLSQFLSGGKDYQGLALLGSETDTQDSEGSVIETVECSHITREQLEAALPSFRGEIMQMPPMYSALKRDGKKLYELARAGIEVEREKRPVTIYSLELMQTSLHQLPVFGLDISCSGGTYVRTLISDIARTCNGRAHMTGLVRSKQGPFLLEDCVHQERWSYETFVETIRSHSEKAGLLPATLTKSSVSFADIKK